MTRKKKEIDMNFQFLSVRQESGYGLQIRCSVLVSVAIVCVYLLQSQEKRRLSTYVLEVGVVCGNPM